MRRAGIVVAATLVLLVAGWWFASPWLALKGMRDAAAAHDERTFSTYVDYAAVRGGLVHEIGGHGVIGLVGRVAGGAASHVVVNSVVMKLLFVMPEGKGEGPVRAENLQMHREGLSAFSMVPKDGHGPTLHFGRYGLGWKLTGFEL
jgi:Protein of unknown function (DUF2939)